MILAIKNKKACYYNSIEEKRELINFFKEDYKVFPNINKKEALLYSNQEKITGFIEKEDPLDVFKDLKQEKVRLISFLGKDSETNLLNKYFLVLNPLYYLGLNEMITYIPGIDMFNPVTFDGKVDDFYNSFIREITIYQKEKRIFSFKHAVLQYIKEYKELIGKYPWKVIGCSGVYSGIGERSEILYFINIGTKVDIFLNKKNEYIGNLKQPNHLIYLKKEEIFDIKLENMFLEITDEVFLSIIKDGI